MGVTLLPLVLLAVPVSDEIVIEDGGDEIVLEDEGEGGAEPGVDDGIIIVDEGADDIVIGEGPDPAPAPPPEVSGALGRLWETWHLELDSAIHSRLQPGVHQPWRTRADLRAGASLFPTRNLKLYGEAFARATLDTDGARGRLAGFADLYEAYAKINAEVAAVQLGRVVVPWGHTTVAALGDRLNPPDHRRGPDFRGPADALQPQLGGVVRTSLGGLGLHAVALFNYEPTEGSVAASEQGGVRLARYQGALVRSATRTPGVPVDDRASLVRGLDFFEATTLGVRAHRRFGDIDLSASAVLAPDATPTLRLNPEVARHLARDAFSAPPVDDACPSLEACLRASLLHEPTASFTADATWGLGVVILKAELLAQPRADQLPGKTSTLISPEAGLHSARLSHYGAALAVEGALGDALSGSLEVFDLVWDAVPAGAHLWGVEPLDADVDEARAVHRLAVGASLGGAVLDERLEWRLRGEGGIAQADVLMSARVRYRLPVGNLYVGGEGALFTGVEGSPGWMRQDASRVGLFLGEGS